MLRQFVQTKIVPIAVVGGFALLSSYALAAAAVPPPATPATNDADQKAKKVDPVVEQADALMLARQLVKYGRANKYPEALVVAAQILATTPTRTGKLPMEEKMLPDAKAGAPAAGPKRAFDVPALLAEARAMAPDSKHLQSLIDKVPVKRGNVDGGSIVIAMTIKAHSEKSTTIEFRGGEDAYIGVSGDGGGDLDCWIYDAKNKQVAAVTDAKDECRMYWVPKMTEKFKLRIRNRGALDNDFIVCTN